MPIKLLGNWLISITNFFPWQAFSDILSVSWLLLDSVIFPDAPNTWSPCYFDSTGCQSYFTEKIQCFIACRSHRLCSLINLLWLQQCVCTTRTVCVPMHRNTSDVRGAFKKFVDWHSLTTRYADHILSLFDIFNCNWHALGSGFLQSSHSIVEELLFLVFQLAICRADNVLVVRNFVSFHEFFQFRKKTEVI